VIIEGRNKLTEAQGLEVVGFTEIIVLLGFTIFMIAVIFFIIRKIIGRIRKREERRLSIERENKVLLQKRIDDLSDRVIVIEKMLREGK
jgi:flagellar biosynthesis/type III secretory pathway M-ring protein FliF/YscJ